MPSAFDNLCGAGKPLKVEPPDANEFAGLKRSGLARLKDATTVSLSLESRLIWPTTLRTRCASPRCAGTATARATVMSCFNCCRTRWGWAPRSGACCPSAMTCATSASTRVTSTSMSASSPICLRPAVPSRPWSRRYHPSQRNERFHPGPETLELLKGARERVVVRAGIAVEPNFARIGEHTAANSCCVHQGITLKSRLSGWSRETKRNARRIALTRPRPASTM